MASDIEIAKQATLKPVTEIATALGIDTDRIELYGRHKAKLPLDLINQDRIEKSNFILVSAISPTPAGVGKTTVSIGLAQSLNNIGKLATAVPLVP